MLFGSIPEPAAAIGTIYHDLCTFSIQIVNNFICYTNSLYLPEKVNITWDLETGVHVVVLSNLMSAVPPGIQMPP